MTNQIKLSDVCIGIYDCPHSTAPDEGHGFPLIRTPNIGRGRLILNNVHRVSEDIYNKRNNRAVPETGDLIFAREAPAGNVAVIQEGQEVCLGQRTVLIKPDRMKVNPNFLVYYLLAPNQQYELLGTANGATVAHVNLPVIRNLPVTLPPLEIQNRIADILSAYDDLIENYQQQISLLEEAAQRIYKEWFVDLRYPGYEEDEIVDGIPKGWKVLKLGKVLSIKYGRDHRKAPDGNSIPVYGSGGVFKRCGAPIYTGESVLIPRKGSLNNIQLVDESFWTVDTMFYTIEKLPNINKLAYFFLKSIDMYSLNTGAAVPSNKTETLNNLDVTIPVNSTLDKFNYIVDPLFTEKYNLLNQIGFLQEARDLLLPRLMSGELI